MGETIIIALLFTKLKGYKIKSLFKNWTVYPIIFMEVIYIVFQLAIFNENYEVAKYVGMFKTLYLCSYLPLVFKYEQYISAIIGSIFMIIGGFLNDIAIAANNGMMPVFPSISYLTGYIKADSFSKINDIHVLGNSETKLKFLTDIFDLGYSVLSLGDIFIRFYVFIIIFKVLKHINETSCIDGKKINSLDNNE